MVSLFVLWLALGMATSPLLARSTWRAGVASTKITPQDAMWMAGYAARTEPSAGTASELRAKALAVEDHGGARLVIVTCDLIAIPRSLRERLASSVAARYALGPQSLLLNASHTHCGPELRATKASIYGLSPERAAQSRAYLDSLHDTLLDVIGRALDDLAGARLSFSQARCGFAINRREFTESGVRIGINLEGPVDHDVPVLRVTSPGGDLRAALFGYACHNTTLSFQHFCGDYSGFASEYVEAAHPGATALFLTGCGGDQNPSPRRTLELAKQHGRSLANAVETALLARPTPLRPPLRSALENVTLDFAPPPARHELQDQAQSRNKYVRRHAELLLEELEREGEIRNTYPYPVQVVRFGRDLTLVALAGEVVVDYSLRFKRELAHESRHIWVAGYSNDVFGYVPSRRVLEEGGYEGGGAMLYTALPGPFASNVEKKIAGKVDELVARTRPPNIVLIVADDLGFGDLGCYGAGDIGTPSIDRLADEGVRLLRFYSNGPECSPTRTALLTGRYQQRAGGLECAIGTGNVGRYDDAIRLANQGELGLPPEMSVLPAALTEVGYAAAAFGKWHLGYEKKFRALEHGFDRAFGPLGGGVDYFHHTEPAGEFLGAELEGEHVLVMNDEPHEREGYLTELITQEAVSWIEKRPPAQRFFAYVPYTAPHTPYQGPGDHRDHKLTGSEWGVGTRAKYAEMVEALDRGVGEILAALEHTGREDETLVIFFSDNGPAKYGSTGGLRGQKSSLFEGGIRVPCVIRWPGHIEPGTVSQQAAISMDLTASIVRIAGGKALEGRALDGIDVVGRIASGAAAVPRSLFWRMRRGERTERAVRSGHLKYLHRHLQDGEFEEFLFDVVADPQEKENRLSTWPQHAERLKGLLKDWEAGVQPER